jgi:NAD(P)-dependent dehydrogenase (short-subunit alcohol dehydrogenase family)
MTNKVVLITGGNRGIGYGIAKAFLADTYKVVINFRSNEEATSKALTELSSDRVIAIKADVSKKEERIRLLKETLTAFGRIDVLVNNAAVASRYSFFKTSEEEYDRVYNTNLKAPIFLSKIVAEQMIKQKSAGSIINIASVAGHRPFGLIYGDSKAALLMATKNMAAKCAKHGIRVNSITPGTHKTDLNRHNWEGDPKSWEKHCKEQIPMGRAGLPVDLGATAVFLASDKANYICGADIIIDGGLLTKR